jgi:hypothetical protein
VRIYKYVYKYIFLYILRIYKYVYKYMDIIEKKRLQWYGHVKRMPEERMPKLILEWVPAGRRKGGGRPRKTWIEGVHAAMTARNLEQNQCRNREEWRLVCGRRRQLL